VSGGQGAVTGRALFDLLPPGRSPQARDGIASLRGLLDHVRNTMEKQDARGITLVQGQAEEGAVVDATAIPVRDAKGALSAIILRLDAAEASQDRSPGFASSLQTEAGLLRQELRAAWAQIDELTARKRAAERLLNIGWWEIDPESEALTWSENVYRIHDMEPAGPTPDMAEIMARVHPEDREIMQENLAAWRAGEIETFRFAHRVMSPRGETKYLRGYGEAVRTDTGEKLVGVVQDVTAMIAASEDMRRSGELLRMAGRVAGFGGWQVDLAAGMCEWSPEVAQIHDSPGTRQVSLDQAIAFYADDPSRTNIRTVFDRCANEGVSFDEIVDIISARGQHVIARATGQPVYNAEGQIVVVEGAFQDITRFEKMRREAEETSELLSSLLEQMNDGFYVIDSEWRFIFVNAFACDMLRKTHDELRGQSIWEAFPETKDTEFQHACERAVETGEPQNLEYFYPPLDAWFRIRLYPVGQRLIGYFRDITEERAGTDRLRLLEAAVAQQGDVLVITEADIEPPDGPRIVYVNDAFERVTGYTAEETIGQTPRIQQGPGTNRATRARIRSALEHGEEVETEILNYRKDGTAFWKDLSIRPLHDAEGQITHWIAVYRDITQRKSIQNDLRKSEERFRLISNAGSTAIWDWDIAEDRIWWSDGLVKTFGHAPTPLQKPKWLWRKALHPDDAKRVRAANKAFLAGKTNDRNLEYRVRRADGSWALVLDRAILIRDRGGAPRRMLGSLTDITETRQLEDQLRHSQKLESVGQLTGGLAHDFNNLLTIVIGNAELLQDHFDDASSEREMADAILHAAERGAELTDRMLSFARRQPLAPKVIDLNRKLMDMEGFLRRTLAAEIDLKVIPDAEPGTAEIDPHQFDNALLNLCLNARDAMPKGGRLTLETANTTIDETYAARDVELEPGEYVMISVSDTGMGMDAETRARAFEPFLTTKATGKGSGLGLSMVWGFVKQSGGHVSLYSEPGEGTTVRLYFARSGAKVESESADMPDTSIKGGTEHILLVEDDAALRAHGRDTILALGYRVTEAANGPDALAALRAAPDVALLFTDVMMPGGMNGRELYEHARAERPDLKVLYTSGYTRNAIVHHGRLDPGVMLLSKPWRRNDLALRIRAALDSSGM
jgi:PAS domain S-box-containing protein